jgi:hypothetical protein
MSPSSSAVAKAFLVASTVSISNRTKLQVRGRGRVRTTRDL